MDEFLLNKIMEEIKPHLDSQQISDKGTGNVQAASNKGDISLGAQAVTEYVGSAIGDTVGIVIANIDYHIHEKLGLDPKFRSIGLISARTGAGPHIMAADEAVKATNTEIAAIELARDTKGGAGHGSIVIFAAEDVSDARRAVEVTLRELERTFGEIYACDAGHVELHYTARASYALQKAFNAPFGKSFGIIVGAPAAIGMLMGDRALKTANVEMVSYASPGQGTAHSNEIIVTITGDSGAVRQSVIAAREVGLSVLRAMGYNPVSATKPYI